MTDNPHGHRMLELYVAATMEGVRMFYVDPDTGERKGIFVVEPDFARRIAENLTLRSFAVEDMRKENIGGGG